MIKPLSVCFHLHLFSGSAPSFFLFTSVCFLLSAPESLPSVLCISLLTGSELRARSGGRSRGRGTEPMLISARALACRCVFVRGKGVLPWPWRHLLSRTHRFGLTLCRAEGKLKLLTHFSALVDFILSQLTDNLRHCSFD